MVLPRHRPAAAQHAAPPTASVCTGSDDPVGSRCQRCARPGPRPRDTEPETPGVRRDPRRQVKSRERVRAPEPCAQVRFLPRALCDLSRRDPGFAYKDQRTLVDRRPKERWRGPGASRAQRADQGVQSGRRVIGGTGKAGASFKTVDCSDGPSCLAVVANPHPGPDRSSEDDAADRRVHPDRIADRDAGGRSVDPACRSGAFTARAHSPGGDRRLVGRRERGAGRRRRGRQVAQPVPRLQDVPGAHGRQPAAGDPVRGTSRHRQDLHGQGDGPRSRRAVPVRVVVGVPVDVLRPDQPQDPLVLQGAAQGCPPRGRGHRVHRGDRRHRRVPLGMGGNCQATRRASPAS